MLLRSGEGELLGDVFELVDALRCWLVVQAVLALDGRVPMVFYGIVGSAWQELSNHRPFVPKPTFSLDVLFMRLDDGLIFLFRPTVLANARVEVVVPPFPALLANPTRQVLGNEAPVLGAVSLD